MTSLLKRFASVLGLAVTGLSLLVFFNNCEAPQALTEPLVSMSGGCNSNGIPDSMRSPTNIDMVTNLINALPKPVTIDCFLAALQKPLQVYAVNNTFSLQPAVNIDSPRIFIIFGNFTMSVVPLGTGARLLETSEIISQNQSVKGEFQFPVESNLMADSPYTRILNDLRNGTKCMGCHSGETPNTTTSTGIAFNSNITRPDPMKRVLQSYMLYQSKVCESRGGNMDRCKMLKAIFQDGAAVDIQDFP